MIEIFRMTITSSLISIYLCHNMADYKKYYIIPESPELVYQALTTESTMRLWTGDLAQFTAEAGTEFSMWDGSIVGRNLAFEASRKIEQEWFFGDLPEPSIVTIILHPNPKGTSLELVHTNIPETDYKDIVDGWNHTYMASLVDFYS